MGIVSLEDERQKFIENDRHQIIHGLLQERKALYCLLNVIEVGLLRKIRMDFVHDSKGSICLLPRKYSLLWGRVEQYAKRFFSIEPAIAGFTDMPWQRKAAFITMYAGVHSQLWQMTCIIMDVVLSALEL